jgi:DNA-binding NtrC family response regulator
MNGTHIDQLQKSFGIIGEADLIKEIIEIIDQVAGTDITILIAGESGTGKELIANALHRHSLRKHKPFIKVNCGAIPAGIIESELFGHVKGAFTGAIDDRKGYFETANNGTIFLDEIGEMPTETQVKLLRVLELGEFLPVGGSEIKKVDVRIIAATNKDLNTEIEKGGFRKDLYYRLKTITIKTIPLREHSEDIPLFIDKFAIDFANRNVISFKGFSPGATQILKRYPWHGNIRELKNFVESIIVLKKGEIITSTDVEKRLHAERQSIPTSPNLPMRIGKSVEQAERELILQQILMLRREFHEFKDYIEGKGREVDIDNLPSYPVSSRLTPALKEESYIEDEEQPEDREQHIINPQMLGKVTFQNVERELIGKTLKKYNYKKRPTANSLQISERTLYRKIKEYGL